MRVMYTVDNGEYVNLHMGIKIQDVYIIVAMQVV